MKNGDRILVKTKPVLSFTGTLVEGKLSYQNQEYLILKTSNESDIMMMIPYNEILKIYTMDGEMEDFHV